MHCASGLPFSFVLTIREQWPREEEGIGAFIPPGSHMAFPSFLHLGTPDSTFLLLATLPLHTYEWQIGSSQ